jgi:protein-L-isoaspartate O-methyltransferase
MVLPIGGRDRQDLIAVERRGDEWLETNDGPVMFVPLIGEQGFADR